MVSWVRSGNSADSEATTRRAWGKQLCLGAVHKLCQLTLADEGGRGGKANADIG